MAITEQGGPTEAHTPDGPPRFATFGRWTDRVNWTPAQEIIVEVVWFSIGELTENVGGQTCGSTKECTCRVRKRNTKRLAIVVRSGGVGVRRGGAETVSSAWAEQWECSESDVRELLGVRKVDGEG